MAIGLPILQVVVFLVATSLAVAIVIVTKHGVGQLLAVVMVLNAVLVPMNSLRLGPLMNVSDALLVGAMPLVIVIRLLVYRRGLLDGYRSFLWLMGVMAFGGLLASMLSVEPLQGLPGVVRFSLSTIAVLVLVALWQPSENWVRGMVWAYVIGAGVSVMFGFVEDSGNYLGRATGLATHPNHLGMTSMLGCGGALALAATAKDLARRVAYAMSALLVVGVVLSGSRAALLGVFVSLGAFLLAARNWRMLRLGAAVAVVMVLGAAFASSRLPTVNAVGRLLGSDSGTELSDRERRILIEDTSARIRQHPVIGSGFEFALEAHSLYLQLWASAGLIGLAGLLLLYARTVQLLVTLRRHLFASALLATFLGYLTAGAASNILWDRYVWTFLALGVAAMPRPPQRNNDSEPLRSASTVSGTLGSAD